MYSIIWSLYPGVWSTIVLLKSGIVWLYMYVKTLPENRKALSRGCKYMPKFNGTPSTQVQKKTLSEILKPKPFYPDLPQREMQSLINESFSYFDCVIIPWQSNFGGQTSFALVAGGSPDATAPEWTTKLNGTVVMKQLRELKAKGSRNILVTLTFEPNKSGNPQYELV